MIETQKYVIEDEVCLTCQFATGCNRVVSAIGSMIRIEYDKPTCHCSLDTTSPNSIRLIKSKARSNGPKCHYKRWIDLP